MDISGKQHLLPENWDKITELVRVGGKIAFDDLIPIELWPPDWDDLFDLKREFAFHYSSVSGTSVRLPATQVAIIVTRIK